MALEVGSGNIHLFVLGLAGIAHPSKHISQGIRHPHGFLPDEKSVTNST
jgi:hypothetical protein